MNSAYTRHRCIDIAGHKSIYSITADAQAWGAQSLKRFKASGVVQSPLRFILGKAAGFDPELVKLAAPPRFQ
jgi:hypothetical protein